MATTKITHKDIIRDVRAGKVAPIYYLMGEEDYYIDRLSEFLTDSLLKPEEKDFNLDILYGPETNVHQIVELAHGFPMMAERRVVLVREAQSLQGIDALGPYLQHFSPTTVLIFCHKHGKLDSRKTVGKLIQQTGVLFESPRLYDNQLPPFIQDYVKRKGAQIEPQATQMLAEHIGSDLCRLAAEIDKLTVSLTKEGNVITPAMVEVLTGISKDFNDFELQAALATRDLLKALRIVRYYQGNPRSYALQKTLATLFTFFSDVMLAYYAPEKSERGIAEWIGKSEWKVRQDVYPAMRNYSGLKVMRILGEIRKTDAASKGVEGCKTPSEELLQELIFYILH